MKQHKTRINSLDSPSSLSQTIQLPISCSSDSSIFSFERDKMIKQTYIAVALCSLLFSCVVTSVIANEAKGTINSCGSCHSGKNCDNLPQPPTDTPVSLEGQNCICCFEKKNLPSCKRNLNAGKDCQSYDAMCSLFCQPIDFPGIIFPAELTYTLNPAFTVPPCQKLVNPPPVPDDIKLSLVNKNVLVVGGSKGIGKAVAERFRDEGANVIATSRHPSCYEAPVGYLLKELDIRFENKVKCFINGIANKYFGGQIDIIVNCAGIRWRGPLAEATGDDLLNILDNNVAGFQRIVHYGLPYMHHSNETRVISFSSVASFSGFAYNSGGYSISKLALEIWNDIHQIEQLVKKAQGFYQFGPTFTLFQPYFVNTTIGLYEYSKASELSVNNPLVLGARYQDGPFQNVSGDPVEESAEAVYRVAVAPQPGVRYIIVNPENVFPVPGFGLLPIEEIAQLWNTLPQDEVIQQQSILSAAFIELTQPFQTILTEAYCGTCAASSQDNTQLKDNSYSSALSDLCNAIKQSQ